LDIVTSYRLIEALSRSGRLNTGRWTATRHSWNVLDQYAWIVIESYQTGGHRMNYTCEVVIDLPRDRVIELFDNPQNLTKWQPGL
jgi:hypothetical protein